MVIGQKHHGKSTFGKMLSDALPGASFLSTSTYLVFRLALKLGLSLDEVMEKKEEHRAELIQLGNEACACDAGALAAIALFSVGDGHVILDGIRRKSELLAARDWFDLILWVERPGIDDGLDNLELSKTDADMVILNNGQKVDLREKADKLATRITAGI